MRCHTESDLARFADRALPFLERDPVRNNNAYSLVAERRYGGWPIEPDALWTWVQDDAGELVGLAMRTPPYPLLLTDMSPVAAHTAAAHFAASHPRLPGVTGPVATCREFVKRWSALTAADAIPEESYRLFRLRQVIPPAQVPGRLREASRKDRALLVRWTTAFNQEALPAIRQLDPATAVDARLAHGGMLWLWEVEETPVTMLRLSLPTAGVTRISGVYTPPERRRQGYASACVAATSQLVMERGATGCVLTTDLANPTSNHIYQAIGYQPVSDTQAWRFLPGGPTRRPNPATRPGGRP